MLPAQQAPSFSKLASHRLLSKKEEDTLGKIIQGKNKKARQAAVGELVTCNMKLAIKIAAEHAGYGIDQDDLVSEGAIGLQKAAERFDPGREPSDEEICEATGISEGKLKHLRETTGTVSLDAPAGENTFHTLGDLLEDENAEDPAEAAQSNLEKLQVAELLAGLAPREREILCRRFGLQGHHPETLETIGIKFRVTRERIRQIEASCLRKLRRRIGKRGGVVTPRQWATAPRAAGKTKRAPQTQGRRQRSPARKRQSQRQQRKQNCPRHPREGSPGRGKETPSRRRAQKRKRPRGK